MIWLERWHASKDRTCLKLFTLWGCLFRITCGRILLGDVVDKDVASRLCVVGERDQARVVH